MPRPYLAKIRTSGMCFFEFVQKAISGKPSEEENLDEEQQKNDKHEAEVEDELGPVCIEDSHYPAFFN